MIGRRRRMTCLDAATISQLLRKAVSAERLPEVEAHLTGCATCAERLRAAEETRRGAAVGAVAVAPALASAGPPVALPPGATVGRYIVVGLVGRGGMGDVYAAFDPELDRKVALKLLHEDRRTGSEERAVRLRREAKAIAKLSHENVVIVYDAGTIDGRAFVAMEFVDGQTVAEWLRANAKPPPSWRAVVDLFLAAGRGLAAAHHAGMVHRDFKPANIMLRKDGSVRVTDFGLARWTDPAPEDREAAGAGAGAGAGSAARPDLGPPASGPGNHTLQIGLTRSGALMGTPAYMSPEQLKGEPIDARSDQFSYCVSLYEALYGERPFIGDNVSTLWMGVISGEVQPAPKHRDVPGWIRRVLVRGMSVKPEDRFPSMAALIAALEDDPAIRRRRRWLAGTAAGLMLAAVLGLQQVASHRRQGLERRITARLEDARAALGTARAKVAEMRELRRRSFQAFDAMNVRQGESSWAEASALLPAVADSFDRAEHAYEGALVLDASRAEAEAELATALHERVLLAEELRRSDEVRGLTARLLRHDRSGARRAALAAPGVVVARFEPAGADATLERFEIEGGAATGRRRPRPVGPWRSAGAGKPLELPAGSYRLLLGAAGRADVVYPFEVSRAQRLEVAVELPPVGAVPAGFVYVPAGELWFGDADEKLRTEFLRAVPLHRRRIDAFLIARHETTYAEWIAFLADLPPAERARNVPGAATQIRGVLRLQQQAGGSWRLTLQPMARRYSAGAGETFAYAGRTQRAYHDWARFPVAGISSVEMQRFFTWLDATGRVPGARFCTELEWERAARGADDRVFPHGDELEPDDANIDVTYGRIDDAFGPDAVGSHPASRSPFGVDDLAGNLFEVVRSSLEPRELVMRGGTYYSGVATARSTNREPIPASYRDLVAGVRVCAPAGPPWPQVQPQPHTKTRSGS